MKRVAYTHFRKPGGKKSRYRLRLDEVPSDCEPVGELEWREVPEPGDGPGSGQWPLISPPPTEPTAD